MLCHNILSNKFNICLPLKKQLTHNKQWVDEDIYNFKHLIHDTQQLRKKVPTNDLLRSRCDDFIINYHFLLKEKRVSLIKDNPHRMWRVIQQ